MPDQPLPFVPDRQVLPRSFDTIRNALRTLPRDEQQFAVLEMILHELIRIRVGIGLLVEEDLAEADDAVDVEIAT